jgi:hypothetical protein
MGVNLGESALKYQIAQINADAGSDKHRVGVAGLVLEERAEKDEGIEVVTL